MEEFAELMEGLRYETAGQAQIPTDRLLEKKDMGGGEGSSFNSLEELIRAVVQFQTLGQTLEKVGARR